MVDYSAWQSCKRTHLYIEIMNLYIDKYELYMFNVNFVATILDSKISSKINKLLVFLVHYASNRIYYDKIKRNYVHLRQYNNLGT